MFRDFAPFDSLPAAAIGAIRDARLSTVRLAQLVAVAVVARMRVCLVVQLSSTSVGSEGRFPGHRQGLRRVETRHLQKQVAISTMSSVELLRRREFLSMKMRAVICGCFALTMMSTGLLEAKERTTEQMRAYAERRIAKADEEQLTKFVSAIDRDSDGKITDEEFARRIEVFQQIFVTVKPIPASSGDKLPENWLTDWEKAREESQKTGKPVVAMFSASWCGPCKMMIANVYPTEEAKQALKAFVPVYIDSEKLVDLASENNIRAYPTFVCFDAEGESVAQKVGGGGVDAFLEMLASFEAEAKPASETPAESKPEEPTDDGA